MRLSRMIYLTAIAMTACNTGSLTDMCGRQITSDAHTGVWIHQQTVMRCYAHVAPITNFCHCEAKHIAQYRCGVTEATTSASFDVWIRLQPMYSIGGIAPGYQRVCFSTGVKCVGPCLNAVPGGGVPIPPLAEGAQEPTATLQVPPSDMEAIGPMTEAEWGTLSPDQQAAFGWAAPGFHVEDVDSGVVLTDAGPDAASEVAPVDGAPDPWPGDPAAACYSTCVPSCPGMAAALGAASTSVLANPCGNCVAGNACTEYQAAASSGLPTEPTDVFADLMADLGQGTYTPSEQDQLSDAFQAKVNVACVAAGVCMAP